MARCQAVRIAPTTEFDIPKILNSEPTCPGDGTTDEKDLQIAVSNFGDMCFPGRRGN